MKNIYSDNAFTGLEAAIVLIAFVVVAAVFSYVVLGAGFFTSQTAQTTTHTAVQQASSSMEMVGNAYGVADGNNSYLKYVNITVALTSGGTAMDISSMVVSYTDNNGGHNANVGTNTAGLFTCTNAIAGNDTLPQEWCIGQKINNMTAGSMLEPNAQMVIVVGLPKATATPNTKLTINFQPAVGAVLPISRTIPGGLTTVQALY
ncbi:archaellin/type IV pilin N-terminal domain-containing protein [Methanoregula sp.]|jgi:flagellin FlaB|uniref:archaellin/type IV pilin N-terminal domain-containing protein n=1 Tax=Methanoregula sp. TaxID=2052170 RepID=UPI003561DBCF